MPTGSHLIVSRRPELDLRIARQYNRIRSSTKCELVGTLAKALASDVPGIQVIREICCVFEFDVLHRIRIRFSHGPKYAWFVVSAVADGIDSQG